MADQSLSKLIIYGNADQLARAVRYAPDQLNLIDEYGYTPLIQTAIVNDPVKTQILLAAGAEVDMPDLTGRTALFWAADNQNLELCQLLLQHKANPNAYSSGGQPILVMPMMKGAHQIVDLLQQQGAKISFAQDFLNAKLIGHSFELEGRIDIVDTDNTYIEVELEGFYLQFTVSIIANLIYEFKNHFAARIYRKEHNHLSTIVTALHNAARLLEKQNYLIKIDNYQRQINGWLAANPLILPVAFDGHAIVLIKIDDYLIRCDRGAFGAEHGAIIFYHINKASKFDKQLCYDLLYKRQGREFIDQALIHRLGLQPEFTLDVALQTVGNCSWANVEAVLPSLLLACKMQQLDGYATHSIASAELAQAKQEVLSLHQYWLAWHRERELLFCIQSMDNASLTRQTTKAALLMAILVQTCQADAKIDQVKIDKIIKVLSFPRFHPAITSYVKVFRKLAKRHPLWKNLQLILDSHGINPDNL